MDVSDFSQLPPEEQDTIYKSLVEKRDSHLRGVIHRCEEDTLINLHLWLQLKQKLQELYNA